MNEEEILLIEQAKQGCQKAFGILHDRYLPVIEYAIKYRIQDPVIVKEISAAVVTKMYYKLDSFTAYDSFKSWVKTIAINTCIDHLRKIKRKSIIQSVDDEDNTLQLANLLSTEEEILLHERKRVLNDAIKTLPLRQRKAIELYYYEGCLCKNIAKKLAVPEGTIKSDLSRARSKLKKLLTIV